MKRITAALLFFTALSTPALAETPVQRSMHSWDYVQSVAYPPAQEAPAVEPRHEPRAYYHHEPKHHDGVKHHGKHHHHDGKPAKHGKHHHHKKGADGKSKDQPKQ